LLAGVVRLWSVKVTVVEATGKLFVSLTLAVAPHADVLHADDTRATAPTAARANQ
jgi:hypothetical protein